MTVDFSEGIEPSFFVRLFLLLPLLLGFSVPAIAHEETAPSMMDARLVSNDGGCRENDASPCLGEGAEAEQGENDKKMSNFCPLLRGSTISGFLILPLLIASSIALENNSSSLSFFVISQSSPTPPMQRY